jgi:hypothetical protein
MKMKKVKLQKEGKMINKKLNFFLWLLLGVVILSMSTPIAQAMPRSQSVLYTQTANDLPNPPRSVTAEAVSQNTAIDVSWQAPLPPPTVEYSYTIELVSDLNVAIKIISNIEFDIRDYTIGNLTPNNYKVNIYTVTADNKSLPASSPNLTQIHLNAINSIINFDDISALPEGVKEAILWAASYNITNGYSDGGFHPSSFTTRAQMATFFHKLDNNLASSGTPADFGDISESVHKDDINWLSSSGITAGYTCTGPKHPIKACQTEGELVYNPEAKVTRVQMAIFLYRFVASPVMTDAEVEEYLSHFSDASDLTNDLERIAVAWLVKYNITAGYPDGQFKPKNYTTRQQMVSFLQITASVIRILPYLKAENVNPVTFLNIGGFNRSNITKITFNNVFPSCNSPVDISFDLSKNILACFEGGEIIIGQPGGVIANSNSQYLFSGLDKSGGVELDLTHFKVDYIDSMLAIFQNTDLSKSLTLPLNFGSTVNNMSEMFSNVVLPNKFVLPDNFGKVATNMLYMFAGARISGDLDLPAQFGQAVQDMSYMWQGAELLSNLVLPDGFGEVATNMSYMFADAQISGNLDIPAGFGSVAQNMSYMWQNTVFPVSKTIFPSNFGKVATNMSYMFAGARISGDLDLPAQFGQAAQDMSYMWQGAELLSNLVLPDGFGEVATNMSYMFKSIKFLSTNIVLPNGFGQIATDMSYMLSDITLPSGLVLPDGFGSLAIDMSNMFSSSIIPANFYFPDNLGKIADNISWMFASTRFLGNATLPTNFGQAAQNMSALFRMTLLYGDIDWSGTDLTNSSATKNNMFYAVTWQEHVIWTVNTASQTFLTTNTGATVDNVQIKP